jgi:hypothetical protein
MKKGYPMDNLFCWRVIDGARTHDIQNHNLALCQLSYDHHFSRCKETKISFFYQ